MPAPRIDPEAVRVYRVEEQIGHLIRRAHQRASAIFDAVMPFEVKRRLVNPV